jgi:DNA repair/transcription protein MET18/MMS19
MLLNAVSAENNSSKLARTSMLWFLQLLVNKFGALDEPLEKESRTLVQIMVDLVEGCSSKSEEEVDNIYHTLAYFTAATVAAHKPQSSTLLDLMIKGISNPRNGRKVAQSFRVLLAPSELMNEQNFCFIRRLRKQRSFTLAATPIIELWRASETKEAKENALLALAGLLAFMEPTTLKDSVESLLPVVLEGINVQNDDWAKHAFIQTILTLLPLYPEVMESHLDSLINRMTDRTHNTLDSPSDSSVRCRAAALDVLALLVQHISPAVLTRRKAKLMFELDVALDDCSSTVRSRADKCKMAWFNLED